MRRNGMYEIALMGIGDQFDLVGGRPPIHQPRRTGPESLATFLLPN
jgi:hypothetical protein